MSFKKKLLAGLIAAACAVLCAFGLAGCTSCNPNKDDETADGFETTWTSDNDYHWHAATDGSDKTDSKAMHDWKEQTDKTVAATCSGAGSKEYKCSVCDAKKTETTAQLSHSWGETKTVAATCTTRGYEYRECENAGCDEISRGKELAALEHLPSAATCTQASVCTRADCGLTVAPALGHDYEAVSEQEATCTREGIVHYACSHEGCAEEYDTVTSAPLAHSVVWEETGERISVASAEVCYRIVYEGYCANDGCAFHDSKTTEIKDHVFTGRITTEATCSADGVKTLTCRECEHSKTETIAKNENAHVWGAGETVGNVTTFHCAADGTHTKQSVVYEEKQAAVPVETLKQTGEVKLADTTIALDEGVKNKINGNESVNLSADTLDKVDIDDIKDNEFVKDGDPVYNLTLQANGQLVSDLGGFVTVTVPYALTEEDDPDHIVIWYINGDKLEEIEGVYSNGFVTFKTNHFSYYTVTRMTPAERCAMYGHNYNVYSEPATCLLAGYELTFCTRCGDSEKVNLPALGHDWEETATAATCTTAGKTHYDCKNCDVSYDVNYPATGHEWTATVYVDATCTKAGNATYKCDNCTETYSVVFPQTAHAFKTTVIEATCTTGGHKHNECRTCGYETDTDHVAALGHTAATKVVAPECTVDGFTLKYCSTCGEEIEKTNVVPATGHTMSGSVCTVCGFGCDHDYRAGVKVEATCIEDGYVPYTCSKCDNGYKGEIEKATGHNFNVDECEKCGTPNPTAAEYYLNLVDTAVGGSMSITLNNLTYSQKENVYKDGELAETNDYGGMTQLDVSTITIAISPAGEITGSGYGSASVTIYTSEDSFETVVFNCKLAATGGKVYVLIESDQAHLVPTMYASLDFDYMLRNMTGGSLNYSKLREYVQWYNSEVNPVLAELINSNSAIVAEAVKFIVRNAFVRTEVKDGYNYLLDYNAAIELHEALYATKISEIADKLLGEGVYAQIPTLVTAILNMTPEQALEYAAKCGLDKDKVCAAIDAFMLITSGQKFDSAAMLEEMLSQPTDENGGTMKTLSVAEFIIIFKQLSVTKAEFIAGVVGQVTAMLDMYKELTVYEVIAPMMGEGVTADDIYVMVAAQLGLYVPMIQESVAISFATDKLGNILSAKISADIEDLVVGGSGGNGSSDGSGSNTPVTEYEQLLSVKGDVNFAFGDKVTIDNELVEAVKAAKPVFAKNAVLVAYSDKEIEKKYENHEYPAIATFILGREMRLHTDGKGNIVKIVVTEERRYRHIERVYGNYYDCYENIEASVDEYEITEGSMLAVSLNYCGDFNAYNVTGIRTGYTQRTTHNRVFRLRTHEIISDVILDTERYNENTYESGTSFYYNPKTEAFMAKDPHGYGMLKVNEEKSDIKCGGFYYMECEDCGYHYNSSIYHLDENYHNNYVYELAAGSTSCKDGVIVKQVCRECKQAVRSYTSNMHNTYKLGEIDLTEYGAKCKHTIYVYGCVCGEYCYTRIDKNYGKDGYGENWDSLQYNYYDYEGKQIKVYRCVVSDCGFNFAFYTESEKDEHCYATRMQKFIFGVTVNEETNTASGGTLYEEFNGKLLAYDYGYSHRNEETKQTTPDGYIIDRKCKDCELKVSREIYSETYDEATRTTVSVTSYTYYKSDVNDNTVDEVRVSKTTETLDADGNLLKRISANEYYDGEKSEANYSRGSERVITYTYESGKRQSRIEETKEYGNNKRLNRTNKASYVYYWYGEGEYDNEVFITESLEEYGFYDGEGNPTEKPSRWHKVEYDYEKEGYCTPWITESTQAAVSPARKGSVSHRAHGDYVELPTCTQVGTRKCLFCNNNVQDGSPNGHRYENGKCVECGLENALDIDGRVVLEDLSYTSSTDYVIGYYNHDTVEFTFIIALVDTANEDDQIILPDFAYTDSDETSPEVHYFRSGKVSFSVAAIAAEAAKLNLTEYMVRVIFASEAYGSSLDYAITIDVHNWVADGEYTVDDGEIVSGTKYCTKCGTVHGVGYLNWSVSLFEENVCQYEAYKNGVKHTLTLFGGSYIQDVEIKNGDIVLRKNYTLTEVRVDGVSVDETELEAYKAQYTLVFTDMTSGLFGGTPFTYNLNGEFVLGGEYKGMNVNGNMVTVIIVTDNPNSESGVTQTEYYYEII